MACRVIADFTMKEGWCEKIRAMLEDEKNGLNLTVNFEGCIDIDMAIDMDDPNRIILTETWETKEHHGKYMEFRGSEGSEGVLAKISENVSKEPAFSWSEVVYTPKKS
jgi:quinol monooxygenase YgiN